MAIKKRECVTQEDILEVMELRAEGYTRMQIAEILNTTFARVKYVISLLPKEEKDGVKRVWYTKERKTFTDAMPNPFPKWWCELHGLDHNFYRPLWKG